MSIKAESNETEILNNSESLDKSAHGEGFSFLEGINSPETYPKLNHQVKKRFF